MVKPLGDAHINKVWIINCINDECILKKTLKTSKIKNDLKKGMLHFTVAFLFLVASICGTKYYV